MNRRLVMLIGGWLVTAMIIALVLAAESCDQWRRVNCRYFNPPAYCSELYKPRPGR